jgi:hypothetical protein|tara:strand:+ start:3561 stop:3893 length:333 start_codon:yes stop_codon:yes gene_type:complete
MASDASGSLCVDWIFGTNEDDFEPIGALDYWQTYAVVEALKPYLAESASKLAYYKAKGEKNKGTDVLEDARDSAAFSLDLFSIALNRMRTAYKKAEYETDSTASGSRTNA